ncbi:helix-turn-helix domain-containing protein [Peribacillus sp. Hz7]|uniref:helix-turn-helix domain-containing protein n=1 Tax=Peribacillus sp. Hz7 TaxID=3344873 RepID=UPI0035C98BF5
MLQNLGQRIRTLRTNKGISLNAFAETLNVSPGYLSNLETGKTDTIHLSLLQKLQSELNIIPIESESSDEIDIRLNHAKQQFKQLVQHNPEGATYLLNILEKGLELLLKKD